MRYGGRQKGTPNKKTQALQERLADMDCDPIEAMVRIGEEAKAAEDWHLAFNVYKELAQYCYPKRKAIEIHETIETRPLPIQVVGVSPVPETAL